MVYCSSAIPVCKRTVNFATSCSTPDYFSFVILKHQEALGFVIVKQALDKDSLFSWSAFCSYIEHHSSLNRIAQ